MQNARLPQSISDLLIAAHDLEHPRQPSTARATWDEVVEFIDAFSIDNPPPYPSTVIAWDLQRTFGVRDGRRLLLRASRRWDRVALTPRQVVQKKWSDDYVEPVAWVDEYIIDLVGEWRRERKRARIAQEEYDASLAKADTHLAKQQAMRIAAEDEWIAFGGVTTQDQLDIWKAKFKDLLVPFARKLEPVTIVPATAAPQPLPAPDALSLEDFYAYLPQHTYIFTPTREMWPASSVNSRLPPVIIPMREKPVPAATWLDGNRAVEQMTWAPGQPMEIRNRLIADGGWINREGCTTFNLYRPPVIKPIEGNAAPWVDHIHFVFGDAAGHIISWLTHRVQRPEVKINHALVLGGAQGIGKDTLLEPIKHAVGPWNFTEVSPQQMLGRFNGFVKSVILRVSEARDLGETDRYGFYEHMKTLTAAPPDVLRVDEKHTREHAVLNVCGVIITTNNKDALFLPGDDRRHFVAWSSRKKEDFSADYWNGLYGWFNRGGNEIVADYLLNLDIDGFNAKAPPPKTAAFWEIVDSSRAPEDAETADALDQLGRPAAVTLDGIAGRASQGFREWLGDRKNRRRIPHRLEEAGYVPVRNSAAQDGLWKINERRQAIYAKRDLSLHDQIAAAVQLSVACTRMPPLPG